MPSLRTLTSLVGSLLSQTPLVLESAHSGLNCPGDGPLSCHNDSLSPTCCFVQPGGQLLLTQFWDTNPTVGPVDSWTMHGLWPDNCDGSYPQYCTAIPQYHNITSILSSHSEDSKAILEYMFDYWLPNAGTLEHFWQHEYNKHATCINTLSPTCYKESSSHSSTSSAYTAGIEVVDFFSTAVALFKTLPTYDFLADAGITPSKYNTYTHGEILQALTNATKHEPFVKCRGGRLDEVWYSFNIRGSLQGGNFEASDMVGKFGRSGCPERGIRYLPKD